MSADTINPSTTAARGGRRAVAAPAPAITVPAPVEPTVSATERVFELTTDEDVLTLVHAFNAVGLDASVVHHSAGSKTVTV